MRLPHIKSALSRGASLSQFASLVWSFLLLLVLSSHAHAEWVLKEYIFEKTGKSIVVTGTDSRVTGVFFDHDTLEHKFAHKGTQPITSDEYSHSLQADAFVAAVTTDEINPVPVAAANYTLTVTPIFEWIGEGVPTKEFIYREHCRAFVFRAHMNKEGRYSPSNLYRGAYVNYERKDPWEIPLIESHPYVSVGSPGIQHLSGEVYKLNRIATTGTLTRGTTRHFSGKVSTTIRILHEDTLDVAVSTSYAAQVTPFSLNLTTPHLVAKITEAPTFKYHIAEADRAWKGTAIESPIEMFYDGRADYEVSNPGGALFSALVNPRFSWHVFNSGSKSSNKVVPPWDIFGDEPVATPYTPPVAWPAGTPVPVPTPIPTPGPDSPEAKETTVAPSSPIKRFHHDVGVKTNGKWQWPQTTTTSVEVKGDDTSQPKIKASGVVTWYPGPKTRFTTKMEVDVIDLETGEVTPFAEIGGSPIDSEEADIDAYIKEIDAKKDETFETGKSLVKAALETQMIVGSWYVPDLIADGATGEISPLTGLPIIGKLAKAVQVAQVLNKAVNVADKLGPKSLKMVQRLRPNGKWALRTRVRAVKEGKAHALPPGIRNGDDEANGVLAKKDCWNGVYCFVAGTLVSTPNGAVAIEKLQKGDLVWAKDESNGQVKPKRITHTIKNVAPATLVLSFAGGERIETTADHPFYVENEGFRVASSLGIGTSIVTRAGPSLAVTGIEKHESPHPVYNLTVEDFSTYFVGENELWVHNTGCPVYGGALTEANKWQNLPQYKTPKASGVMKGPDGQIYPGSSRNQHSNAWTIHPKVAEIYNDRSIVPSRSWSVHAKCAEAKILSDLAGSGASLERNSMTGWSSMVINSNHHDDNFGAKRKACMSCRKVLQYLGIIDLAL